MEFQITLINLGFLIMLAIVYFSKRKIKFIENKFYSFILIFSLLYAVINSITYYIICNNSLDIINTKYYNFIHISNSFMTTLYVGIIACIMLYTICLSYKKTILKINLMFYFLVFIMSLNFITSIFADMELLNIDGVVNISGNMIYLALILITICILISLVLAIISRIKRADKTYSYLIAIMITCIVSMILSQIYLSILMYDISMVFLVYIMFFSIENPDVKTMQLLYTEKNRVAKANEAKSDFLSSMSHEIRTPLNAIIGLSEDIKNYNDKIPKEVLENTDDILEASNDLLEIVGNILDLNKIETEKLDIKEEPYNVREEITKIYRINLTRIGDKNLSVRLVIDNDVPKMLLGDKSRIKQLANNLLSNAIKYTESGYVEIRLSFITKDNKTYLVIKVQDTGKGISSDNINKLFNRFERLEMKNSNIEGTGLGLVITKKLVDIMNGEIYVDSEINKGSIFTIVISQEEVMGKIEKLETIDIESNKDLSNVKILMVDDNLLNIKVAMKTLKRLNTNIEYVTSGSECLEKMKKNHYDIILMDIMMPIMSGEETFNQLKTMSNFNTPVIAVTADALKGSREHYLEVGFTDYISKPYTKDEISTVIQKVLLKSSKKSSNMV